MKKLRKLLGYCEHCDRWFVYPKKRRQNTAYIEEEMNYVTCCKECFDKIEIEWEHKWEVYGRRW